MPDAVFPFPGGKSRLASWILEYVPEHTCFVEVFGGAAGVLVNKDPDASMVEVYNDRDGDLVQFFEETELTDGLPLDVDVFVLRCIKGTIVHAKVLIECEDHPELVVDPMEGGPHHADGDQLSTLADLGEEYADLERDLLEVSALLCDLPEFEDEVEKYVDRVAFQSISCYEGLLAFRFGIRMADVIVQAYQDFEHELGEQVWIPIEPPVEEMVGRD